MIPANVLAQLESKLQPLIARVLSPAQQVALYSSGRPPFLKAFFQETPEHFEIPSSLERTCWGIRFRSPLFNAAGMFKNAEGFNIVDAQGAGAYLGGTGTWNKRAGNEKEGVHLPFVPYRRSHAASNWLGLPNDGDPKNIERASHLRGKSDCPIGWSVMESPNIPEGERAEKLVKAMHGYARAGVDFIENNWSCPNVTHGQPRDGRFVQGLQYIKEHFLDRRLRRIPVIAKFSTDTALDDVPYLMDTLFSLGFDGVNFGNTSIAYEKHLAVIDPAEQALYRHFTTTFGGGISGKPLKKRSLELAAAAVAYHKAGPPKQEFHVIRTGGIESAADLKESDHAGISLNQWFTGYFEGFSKHQHSVYHHLYQEYAPSS